MTAYTSDSIIPAPCRLSMVSVCLGACWGKSVSPPTGKNGEHEPGRSDGDIALLPETCSTLFQSTPNRRMTQIATNAHY